MLVGELIHPLIWCLQWMPLCLDLPLRLASWPGSKYPGCRDRCSAPASPKFGQILYGECGLLLSRLWREAGTSDRHPMLLEGWSGVLAASSKSTARWGPSIPPYRVARAPCAFGENRVLAPELALLVGELIHPLMWCLQLMPLCLYLPLRLASWPGSKYPGCCDRSSAPASSKSGQILYGECGLLPTRLWRDAGTPAGDPMLLEGWSGVLAAFGEVISSLRSKYSAQSKCACWTA